MGTKDGGLKTSKTIREKYGADHWQKIGKIGGANGNTGGFYANRELAKTAGTLGGMRGRRGHKFLYEKERFGKIWWYYTENETGKKVKFPAKYLT